MDILSRKVIVDEVLAFLQSDKLLRGSSGPLCGVVNHSDGSSTPWRISSPEDFISSLAHFERIGSPVGDFQEMLWNPLQEAWISIGPLNGMRQVEDVVLYSEGLAYLVVDSSPLVRRMAESLNFVDKSLGSDDILLLLQRLLKALVGSLIYSRALTGEKAVGWCEATFKVLVEGLLPYGYDAECGAILCFNPVGLRQRA